eukprot:6209338-Pleurochrysis_carterae.AAC.1
MQVPKRARLHAPCLASLPTSELFAGSLEERTPTPGRERKLAPKLGLEVRRNPFAATQITRGKTHTHLLNTL